MKIKVITFLCLLIVSCVESRSTEFRLSRYSDAYNTRYFFISNNEFGRPKDNVIWLTAELPNSFVIETPALKEGQQLTLVYNNETKIPFFKMGGVYYINNVNIGSVVEHEEMLSLYFVNNKLIFYIDDYLVFECEVLLEKQKKIGVIFPNTDGVGGYYYNAYEPIPFIETNYGAIFEKSSYSNIANNEIHYQNVGKGYNLSFPTENTCQSKRSIRFEYRFKDSKADNSFTNRARSEISGVYSKSLINKWIIDFDLYIPSETKDDNDNYEIITQLHEGSAHPTTPSFYLSVLGGFLCCNLNGDSIAIEKWASQNPSYRFSKKISYLKKNTWHHVKIFIKSGFAYNIQPVTKIWLDSQIVIDSNHPNCYNYTPLRKNYYDYLKFGIYKPGWVYGNRGDKRISKRIYYFDNYTVKN